MIRELQRTLCYRNLLVRQTVQLIDKIAGPLMEVGEGELRCGLVRGPGRIPFSRPVRYGAERIQYGP